MRARDGGERYEGRKIKMRKSGGPGIVPPTTTQIFEVLQGFFNPILAPKSGPLTPRSHHAPC